MSDFEHSYISVHSPDDVWRAVNTPLSPEEGLIVNPGLIISYEDLSEENQIQVGTRIVYVPSEALLENVPRMGRGFVPKDITLRVEEQVHEDRSRVDVLESTKAQGKVQRRVEVAGDGSGLLVVEAKLSIEGLGSMFEGMVMQYGIDEPTQRTLQELPKILGVKAE